MKKRAPERSYSRGLSSSRTRSKTISRRASVPRAGTRKPAALKSSNRARPATRTKKASASTGSQKSAKLTTNHEKIRAWVESRGGQPATVASTARGGKKEAGVLRIDFPGFSGARSLKSVPWDKWFKTFDERRLAFLYQDKTAAGKPSRFNKLVSRK